MGTIYLVNIGGSIYVTTYKHLLVMNTEEEKLHDLLKQHLPIYDLLQDSPLYDLLKHLFPLWGSSNSSQIHEQFCQQNCFRHDEDQ